MGTASISRKRISKTNPRLQSVLRGVIKQSEPQKRAGANPGKGLGLGKRVSGDKLRALMTKYGLQGDAGAAIVGALLYQKPLTIQVAFSRGMRLKDFELLEFKLARGDHEKVRARSSAR